MDNPIVDDSKLPIAIKKVVGACTRHPISNFISCDSLSPSYRAFVSFFSSVSIPPCQKEALINPKWSEAMIEELKALKKNDTQELVSIPQGARTARCRWVFTVKQQVDGTVERYKARLVAKGFMLTYDIDYQKIFAPMTKMNSIRAHISYAANLG